MKLNIVILSMLIICKEITAKANKPKNLQIDDMLPSRVEPSAEVLLIDNSIIYEFNIETFDFSDAMNASIVFKKIEFPVKAASFNRRTLPNGSNVNAVVFYRNHYLYFRRFKRQIEGSDKLLDNVDNLGKVFHMQRPEEFNGEIQGMTADSSNIAEDVQFIFCNGKGLFSVDLPKGNPKGMQPPNQVLPFSNAFSGCNALTMVKKNEEIYLLMSTTEKLKTFKIANGQVDDEVVESLDIEKDILGQDSWLTITMVALVIGIVLVVILFAALIGFVIYRRKQRESVTVTMQDQTTTTHKTRSRETILRKAKK